MEILQVQLADTLKAHIMQPDGSYEKQNLRGRDKLEAQQYFCKQALNSVKEEEKNIVSRVFVPRTKSE